MNDAMKDEPVLPLHTHESEPVERSWLNSIGYLVILGAVVVLVIATVFGGFG